MSFEETDRGKIEADEDIANGRVHGFDTDELIEWLEAGTWLVNQMCRRLEIEFEKLRILLEAGFALDAERDAMWRSGPRCRQEIRLDVVNRVSLDQLRNMIAALDRGPWRPKGGTKT